MAELNPEHVRFPALAARKDMLDTLNSLAWFSMDAAWMLGLFPVAFFLAPIVLGSALLLLLIDRRPAITAINSGIIAWVLMNITWMVSDVGDKAYWLLLSRGFFLCGLVAIGCAVALSDNLRATFSHFRRFRLKDWT